MGIGLKLIFNGYSVIGASVKRSVTCTSGLIKHIHKAYILHIRFMDSQSKHNKFRPLPNE